MITNFSNKMNHLMLYLCGITLLGLVCCSLAQEFDIDDIEIKTVTNLKNSVNITGISGSDEKILVGYNISLQYSILDIPEGALHSAQKGQFDANLKDKQNKAAEITQSSYILNDTAGLDATLKITELVESNTDFQYGTTPSTISYNLTIASIITLKYPDFRPPQTATEGNLNSTTTEAIKPKSNGSPHILKIPPKMAKTIPLANASISNWTITCEGDNCDNSKPDVNEISTILINGINVTVHKNIVSVVKALPTVYEGKVAHYTRISETNISYSLYFPNKKIVAAPVESSAYCYAGNLLLLFLSSVFMCLCK